MDGTAIVLTNGLLHTQHAKTAHGLIRGTERFQILGIIDHVSAGKDAGTVLDGRARGIPVFASLADALSQIPQKIDFCIVGIAVAGGKLPEDFQAVLKDAIRARMSIVNGLHDFLSDLPDFQALAQEYGVKLIDVRKPKPKSELSYWSGRICTVTTPRVAVLGTDCAIGKRTTCRFLTEAACQQGLKAEMIYTGQTGWMQGGKYGFIFDATINDFVTGELESALVKCFEEARPDIMFIEGQSALRNPLGPCGSEFIISGQVKAVVLQHKPARRYFKGTEACPVEIPSVKSEVELIRTLGAETLALTLNTDGLTPEEVQRFKALYREELGIPVVLPLEEGVGEVLNAIRQFFNI
ncbi:MAG: DUF1611 domain-containing protein [Candidatus Thermochlorobacter aerophilum]|jgi:uncharacterized NAD-dependent epimerase/dehydratase family protein|uniref:DUF1611 domain-containing protein n=1 Tax=Candidatus Thermochlorobacter aerophilus TaxID=1868324 RepID=A0A395M099_9BACT|nr:MAG: DUF1611 domain-containing protein [Candidatus Thermochlorobacter aerophilum]